MILILIQDGVIDFAEFLNIIHLHIQSSSPNKEILDAFKAYDVRKTGYLNAKELRSILTSTGERLTNKDGTTQSQIALNYYFISLNSS